MRPEEREKLKREEIKAKLALAKRYLRAGKFLLKEKHLRVAIDTTHNAAELAAKRLNPFKTR